ncbi:formylglycine-generating enzyme family protein [Rhodococcus sp. 14-2470-1b]|uniref:formylglycine-generating enzyme family protein n=1 Tax=Rhodococcus sp. 14-2470-1b TaxID=2023149 RepID=UPI0020CD94A8|nr:formylglycine-generating enzyme family protein [Rhodococcus sp. 14-2470-1b]
MVSMSGGCCAPDRNESSRRRDLPGRGADPGTLVDVPGGTFLMGSEDPLAYPADLEGPVRRVQVASFSIAPTTVTVAEFDAFVSATGYVTDAEQFGDSLVFAGSLPAEDSSPAVTATPWFNVVSGASWRRPSGPASSITPAADHPVTHVSRRDADAYCAWVGASLPSEEQWEYAARGGLEQQPFPWGADESLDRMNTWRGEFPGEHVDTVFTAPVRSFEPNGYGLYNTTGNVWEWTTGTFDAARRDTRAVIRGGSHLCHASYCRRYRTSARSGVTEDTSSSHIGFRLSR